MKPHKHAELIHAWADGADVQWKHPICGWVEVGGTPDWLPSKEYRIKPEPKPDIEFCLFASPFVRTDHWKTLDNNIKLTFDGETGKLKSAEVL